MTLTMEQTHGVSKESWGSDIFSEYLGSSLFFNFMGSNTNAPFQVSEDLTKEIGDKVKDVHVDVVRHAVVLRGDPTEKRQLFDIRNQARDALVDWAQAHFDRTIGDLLSQPQSHALTFSELNPSNVTKAKRTALLDAKIKPYKFHSGLRVEETYIMFVHPENIDSLIENQSFKDVNTNIPPVLRDAVLVHGQKYKGIWDGVMIFETEVMDVDHVALCGQQALSIEWAKRTNYKEDLDDYGHENGFAIDEIRGTDFGVKGFISVELK